MSERLRKKVPASVSKFWACDGCRRVYWEGPKYTPTSAGAEPSPDGRVVYRPVPRKRVSGDRYDQRHLPDPRL
jgi:ribosomal protein L37AE/L43A